LAEVRLERAGTVALADHRPSTVRVVDGSTTRAEIARHELTEPVQLASTAWAAAILLGGRLAGKVVGSVTVPVELTRLAVAPGIHTGTAARRAALALLGLADGVAALLGRGVVVL
jgi:hypothetical protein